MTPQPPKLARQLQHLENPALESEDFSSAALADVRWAQQTAKRLSLDTVKFIGGDLSLAKLRDSTWTDVAADGTTLVGLDLTGSALHRVGLSCVRADGLVAAEAQFKDVTIRGSKLDLANFRFAKLMRVQFIDCSLRELDFMGAQLSQLTFVGCDLTGSNFSGAHMASVDLRGARFEHLAGLGGLRGAKLDTGQLMALAPYLAAELGITVSDE